MADHHARTPAQLTWEGMNRRATMDLPQIRPCFGTCGNLTRPRNMKAGDAPYTVRRESFFYCQACKNACGDERPAALAEKFAELEAAGAKERGVLSPTELQHITRGLDRFLAGRQQRERRRDSLARINGRTYSSNSPTRK